MLHFWRPGLRSSWISDGYLEQQRRRLPAQIYQRLHEALWVGGANAAWSREQVEACVDPGLAAKTKGTAGRDHFCGVDIGWRRDRTAAAIVSWAGPDRLELDALEVWKAPPHGEVWLADVEGWLVQAREAYPGLVISADPTEFIGSMQRLGEIEEARFTSELVRRLSVNLHGLIASGRLRLFEHGLLLDELLTINVRSTSYGWRLDHESGRHDDCVIALGLACLAAADHGAARAFEATRDGLPATQPANRGGGSAFFGGLSSIRLPGRESSDRRIW
jgi:hypothetical protein